MLALAVTYAVQALAVTCAAEVLARAARETEALEHAVPNLRIAQYPAAHLSRCQVVQKVCQIRHRQSHDDWVARQALCGAALAREVP